MNIIKETAAELVALLRQKNIKLSYHQGNLRVFDPDKNLDHELVNTLKHHKPGIIEMLRRSHRWTPSDFPHVSITQQTLDKQAEQYDIDELLPTTPLQMGMLYHAQLDKKAYVSQVFPVLRGRLNTALFREAWQLVTNQYDALKTAFVHNEDGGYDQLITTKAELPWREEILSNLNADAQQKWISDYLAADRERGLDIHQAPLQRIALFHLGNSRYQLIWTHHHSIIDGWSSSLVYESVVHTYVQLIAGQNPELTSPKTKIYIDWLMSQDEQKSKAYWQNYLSELPAVTTLFRSSQGGGTDSTRTAYRLSEKQQRDHSCEQTQSESHSVSLNIKTKTTLTLTEDESRSLSGFARDNKVTMNTLFQLAWGYVLQLYSHQYDVVFGTTVSVRPHEVHDMEQMVGLFINTIPVRCQFSAKEAIKPLLRQLQTNLQHSIQHGYIPLSEVNRQREQTQSELFDTLLVFENYPLGDAGDNAEGSLELTLESSKVAEESNYKLSIAGHFGDQIKAIFTYQREDISTAEITQLIETFKAILIQLPKVETLSDIRLDTPEVLPEKAMSPASDTLVSKFEKAASLVPENTAVRFAHHELSYEQLLSKSNQLAICLIEAGVNRGDHIGLLFNRSIDMVVSMLAVMQTGAAYVPIAVDTPSERISFIVSDCNLPFILKGRDVALAHEALDIAVLDYESVNMAAGHKSKDQLLDYAPGTEDIAYIIYTSGTTGHPKGVRVAHRNLMTFLDIFSEQLDCIGSERPEQWLWHQSYAFDASFKGMAALCHGMTVTLAGDKDVRDADALADLLIRNNIEVFNGYPRLVERVLEALQDKNRDCHLIVSGQDVEQTLWNKLADFSQSSRKTVLNAYGPTETTVNVAFAPIRANSQVNIGCVRGANRGVVLGLDGQVLPLGCCGELCIYGPSVVPGYLNVSSDNFVEISLIEGVHVRVYRTGDRVRLLTNGSLQFIGRIDEQIKLRGYRIELAEIEQQAKAIESVQEAAALVSDREGSEQLYLFVTGDEATQPISDRLKSALPVYMQPDGIIKIDVMPRNVAGKLNRRELAKVLAQRCQARSAPETMQLELSETEQKLKTIWQQVLGLEELDVSASFFDLGGDSIMSMKLVTLARRAKLKILARELLQAPSVTAMAKLIDSREVKVGKPSAMTYGTACTGQLTPIQNRFFKQVTKVDHFNQSLLLLAPKRLNFERLKQIVRVLVGRHESLRCRYIQRDGNWTVDLIPSEKVAMDRMLVYEDLSTVTHEQRTDAIEAACRQAQTSLKIDTGELVRVIYFDCGEEPARVCMAVHHLAVDNVSWTILLTELEEYLLQLSSGESILPASVGTTMSQWRAALSELKSSEQLAAQLPHWRQVLSAPVTPITTDRPMVEQRLHADCEDVNMSMTAEQTEQILARSAQLGPNKTDVLLLAALHLTLHRWCGGEQFRIELESHGRDGVVDDIDISGTIGWFTSMYPVLLSASELTPAAVLSGADRALEAVDNNGVGFGILSELGDSLDGLMKGYRQDIQFNYLGQLDKSVGGNSLFNLAPERIGPQVAGGNCQQHLLRINSHIIRGQINFAISYHREEFDKARVQRLADNLKFAMLDILECAETPVGLTTEEQVLVPLQPLFGREPLCFVHPVGGLATCYSGLAKRLSDHYDCYGLQAPDIFGGRTAESVTELAEYYVSLLVKAHPQGPYRLVGWSSGGKIAYEMALLLKRAGHKVSNLSVLDQAPQLDTEEGAVPSGLTTVKKFLKETPLEVDWAALEVAPLGEALDVLSRCLVEAKISPEGLEDHIVRNYLNFLVTFPRMMREHKVNKSALPLDLYKAREELESMAGYGQHYGWDRITQGRIRTFITPGRHDSLLSIENQDTLAALLADGLK